MPCSFRAVANCRRVALCCSMLSVSLDTSHCCCEISAAFSLVAFWSPSACSRPRPPSLLWLVLLSLTCRLFFSLSLHLFFLALVMHDARGSLVCHIVTRMLSWSGVVLPLHITITAAASYADIRTLPPTSLLLFATIWWLSLHMCSL